MKRNKHLILLGVAAIIFIIAAMFSGPTNNTITGAGNNFFPGLLSHANDVSLVQIQTHDDKITLNKSQDKWLVKENSGYPADISKVRRLVLGLSNLKKIEPKTSNSESYSRIGLQDVTEKDATSTQITLYASADEKLADIIIGHSKPSKSDSTLKSYYVRTPGDTQSWLVDGSLPDQWKPRDWLDTDVFEIDRDRIEQVKVTHDNGAQVYIHRDNSGIRDFTLDGLKPGEEINAPFEVNNIATTFTKMTFDNVVAAATADVGDKPDYTAVLTAFDGLEISFRPYTKGDKHLVKYTASYNEAVANANRERLIKQQETAKTASSSEAASSTNNSTNNSTTGQPDDSVTPGIKLATAEQVKQEVEKYNALWENWLYELPEFRINNIGKAKVDLLKKHDKPIHATDKKAKQP